LLDGLALVFVEFYGGVDEAVALREKDLSRLRYGEGRSF
jgi:hypothetical protein